MGRRTVGTTMGAALAALVLAGCSIGTPTVAQEDVEKTVSDQLEAAVDGTPYTLTATDDGFDLAVDWGDQQWFALLGNAGVSRTFIHHVHVDVPLVVEEVHLGRPAVALAPAVAHARMCADAHAEALPGVLRRHGRRCNRTGRGRDRGEGPAAGQRPRDLAMMVFITSVVPP